MGSGPHIRRGPGPMETGGRVRDEMEGGMHLLRSQTSLGLSRGESPLEGR